MDAKVISRNVGYALLVSALFMFLSILVSVADGNDSALAALLISFVITFTSGIFPFIFVRKSSVMSIQDGYVIIVLSWLLSFIFGMLPYALWGGPFTIVNAWFESVSGFTTTGATILESVESLPDSLLFWRSSTHFIGGLGVVVFLLLIIPNTSQMRLRLTNMELSSLSRKEYKTRANKTVFIFTYVYLGLTVAAFICYKLAGMSSFDAVNHAMSVVSTGGFSTKNLSIAQFDSMPVTLVTMVFMLLASLHFGMLFIVFVTRSLKPFKNEVFKFYAGGLLMGAVLVGLSLKVGGICETWGDAVLQGSFNILTFASTTGFAISDNASWPFLTNAVLLFFGIRCGMAGSTTGGLKSDRSLLFYKQLSHHLKSVLHPASIHEVRMNGRIVPQDQVTTHVLYVVLFFCLVAISFLMCLLFGMEGKMALSATISSISNIGPAIGEVGTFGNYNMMPSMVKVIFSIDMFLGRVEVYPVLAVFMMLFGKREK